jgi:hypothetical protein
MNLLAWIILTPFLLMAVFFVGLCAYDLVKIIRDDDYNPWGHDND